MSNTNKINWTIQPLELPKILKRCSKCGQEAYFINSEKFRVNANKKHLDIWLIYQCESCKSTYNLTVHERISPRDLSNEHLEQFMRNDKALAGQIGFDSALHARNKVFLDLSEVPIAIVGDIPNESEATLIEIECTVALGLRADKVLSQKLSVSRASIKQHILEGRIKRIDGKDLLKEKMKGTIEVLLAR